MKKLLISFLILLSTFFALFPKGISAGWVNGYTKSNGTYVSGYWRSDPNGLKYDNYSFDGDWSDAYNDSYYSSNKNYSSDWYTPAWVTQDDYWVGKSFYDEKHNYDTFQVSSTDYNYSFWEDPIYNYSPSYNYGYDAFDVYEYVAPTFRPYPTFKPYVISTIRPFATYKPYVAPTIRPFATYKPYVAPTYKPYVAPTIRPLPTIRPYTPPTFDYSVPSYDYDFGY